MVPARFQKMGGFPTAHSLKNLAAGSSYRQQLLVETSDLVFSVHEVNFQNPVPFLAHFI
jgi:hypothetical protein